MQSSEQPGGFFLSIESALSEEREAKMRLVFVALLFSISAIAQNSPSIAAATAACGQKQVTFDIRLDNSHSALPQVEEGKALVYFMQDRGGLVGMGIGPSVTRVGLDGAWVGANKNESYFAVTVEPGEHHFCINDPRSFIHGNPKDIFELAHFTAEAGKVYYFRIRNFSRGEFSRLEVSVPDSDEASYLIASSPMSIAHAKK
jgi:hypothetical protein